MHNEFDDHIKKRVYGFKLPPSAQVWDLVEAHLPQKKRRRFIFWWLPLGILLIGIGVYEFVGYDKKNKLIADNKTTIQINKIDKKDAVKDLPKINNPSEKIANPNIKIAKKVVRSSNNNNIEKERVKSNKGNKETEVTENNNGKKIVLNNGTDFKIKDKLLNKNPVPENNVSNEVIAQEKINSGIKNEINTKDESNTTKKENGIINRNLDSQAIIKSIDSSAINLVKKKAENKKSDSSLIQDKKAIKINSPKFKWELIGVIGNANTIGNALSSSYNSQYFSSPNSGVTPGNNLGNGTVQATLSAPKPGLSFGINLQRTKQITKHLAWYGSAGYSYLSNRQASGALVDSSKIIGGDSAQFLAGDKSFIDKVPSYYKYGNTLNHTNYIHLFNVSVGLKYNISKAFSLNGGIGFGYQIKSKWLQPDINQSILYYSNKLTNKWNIGTNIGFNWQFAQQLSVGVVYNYSFSKASLAAVQQNLHWQSFGATISVQLPFKK